MSEVAKTGASGFFRKNGTRGHELKCIQIRGARSGGAHVHLIRGELSLLSRCQVPAGYKCAS